jgi:hypothetical protein
MVFIKAQAGPPNVGDSIRKFTVQYFDEKGNLIIRSGGTRAWRCNNPGVFFKSPYSIGKDRRSIGVTGYGEYEYAVYPGYATEHEALVVMLRGSRYFHLTLKEASERYVHEDPDHIRKIVKISKLDPNRTIKSLSDEEFEIYWTAIEQNEGWKVGDEEFIEEWIIAGVHKNRGVVSEYLIDKASNTVWISKEEAIKLANEKRLHATVMHRKNGTTFLRPEYHAHAFARIV